MIFKIIVIVNLVVYVSADVLQVKCGDEKCEKPVNRASTTLRYTPDKPYKLRINAVNSDVDIFGVTNDLYFCRHGKNFGFLPKHILREKSRGNFQFDVTVDLTGKHIDQSMREQNFLNLLVGMNPESSQPTIDEAHEGHNHSEAVTTSENIDLVKKLEDETKFLDQHQHTHDNEAATVTTTTEPSAPITNTDLPIKQPDVVAVKKVEEPTDSGVEDEGDDDDDDEDDEEEDDEKVNQKPAENIVKKEPEQPELIAVPPGKPKAPEVVAETTEKPKEPEDVVETTETPKEEVKVEEVPTPAVPEIVTETPKVEKPTEAPVEPVAVPLEEITTPSPVVTADELASTTILPNLFDEEQNIVNSTLDEPAPVHETTDETQEITPNQQASNELPPKETVTELPSSTTPEIDKTQENEIKTEDEKPSEEVESNEKPIENLQNEPADKTTTTVQSDSETTTVIPQLENVESTTENAIETSTPTATDNVDTTTVQSETVEITTSMPDEPETTTTTSAPEIVELPQSEQVETTTSQPMFKPSEPDALMKRLRQKIDNNKAKDVKKPEEQHHHNHHGHEHHEHHHGHSHEHHSHGHGHVQEQLHEHSHDHPHHHEESPSSSEVDSIDDKEEDDGEAGFFGGLYNKFFAGSKDSSDETATITNEKPAASDVDEGFCEKIDGENCPKNLKKRESPVSGSIPVSEMRSTDDLVKMVLQELIGNMNMAITMALTAVTVLIFTFGYYCMSKSKREGPLIGKINELERHLMASVKENEMLRTDITTTNKKLMSIQDNSFGSNDMVIALKKDLEARENEKQELLEKIDSLESQLETATEDGLELQKMVSDLLNNQTGSETILKTVEELESQLNEQQETILTVNESLAVKSRENSDLLMQIAHIEEKHDEELRVRQQGADAIALERNNLLIEIGELKRETDSQLTQLVQERNSEVTRLNTELTNYIKKYDETNRKFISVESKAQAMEEMINSIKREGKTADFKNIFDVADLKADLLATVKEKSTVQEALQAEKDARKLLEDRVKGVSEEMSKLKIEFGVAEKEKLEAQTRLDVLSTYFKEKETQLQKELSAKEALWLKSQGETTSTVEKIQALNNEVQQVKSQNDALRAEIEAQNAAHKLNISSIEAQSHTAWLNARQAERRLEETRTEAAALRRRLTQIAETPTSSGRDVLNGLINDTMKSIPSPERVESPNNPNQMIPPPLMMPPFLPQGFLPGAPPPFMPGLPPFMPPPPGDHHLPPLGRLMSPPPKRFDDRDRYSPRGGRGGRYTPDSRYDDDYTAFETETDYSPPPSPSPPRRGYNNSQSDRSKKSKGGNSSTGGSVDSNPRRKK